MDKLSKICINLKEGDNWEFKADGVGLTVSIKTCPGGLNLVYKEEEDIDT
jgi:hypothetical protein